MAILGRNKKKGRRNGGLGPAAAGLIALVIIVIATFEGFTRTNPFRSPFEVKATFRSANNIQPKSPVRIAGVTVGAVKKVKALKGGKGATLTMEIKKTGLPIHKDAEMKIRPRIFLEGNFFVDVQPGTPNADKIHSGDTIPVNQTSTPVQLGDVLTALQSDTRSDLKTLIEEYAQKGLGNGGAEAYNRGLDTAPEAFRTSAIANEATLGRRPHDLSNVLRGQQRLFAELARNPEILKDLVTQLEVTFGALAREDTALRATIPALRDVLKVGRPALAELDATLPALRGFARDALPATRSSLPTINASTPFIHQVRLLVRKQELRGLVADLRPTIPALARLNRATIPFLNESRAMAACTNNVLLPFSKEPIPDPDFPANTGQPFYKQGPRGFVGLAGESRLNDLASPLFHANIGAGATTITNFGDRGEGVFAAAPAPPQGTRPARPNKRPSFHPDVPCETQQPPDLNAPGGAADKSVTQTVPGGLLPPLPGVAFNQKIARQGKVRMNELKDYFARKSAGKPVVDPLSLPQDVYQSRMRKLGLKVTSEGKVVAAGKGGTK